LRDVSDIRGAGIPQLGVRRSEVIPRAGAAARLAPRPRPGANEPCGPSGSLSMCGTDDSRAKATREPKRLRAGASTLGNQGFGVEAPDA
jgi:hypothetical protein